MEYTRKQRQKIKQILNEYDTFTEQGTKKSLGVTDIDIHTDDLIARLIDCVGYYKYLEYTEKYQAFELLTSQLIVNTVIPIHYRDECGISLFDMASVIDSKPLRYALQVRFDIENEKKLLAVTNDYKRKYKHR